MAQKPLFPIACCLNPVNPFQAMEYNNLITTFVLQNVVDPFCKVYEFGNHTTEIPGLSMFFLKY